MKKFLSEFKTFITRGNIVDMAVGVLVGSAFTAIVNALTQQIFQPLINWALAGTGNGLEAAVTMLKAVYNDEGVLDMAKSIYINWGAFITAIINFVFIAFSLFCVVKFINNMRGEVRLKFFNYTKAEYFEMRKSGLKRKDIEQKAKERDEAAARAAEEEANKPKPETQEDILRDIRELLKKTALDEASKAAIEQLAKEK